MLTTSTKVKKHRFARWVCGSAWMASLVPFLIFTAIITTFWFVIFWAFDSTFTKLWPVADYLWILPIILFVPPVTYLFYQKIVQDERRAQMFSEFCAACLSAAHGGSKQPGLAELPTLYVLYHRNAKDTASKQGDSRQEPKSQMSMAISNIQGQHVQILYRTWYASVLLEKQTRNIMWITFCKGLAWLLCFSLPFLFWSYYNWFGFFGCLLVDWPILALVHGATKRINYYEDHAKPHSWFLNIDYYKLAQRCRNEIQAIQGRQ